MRAIEAVGCKPGDDVVLALDCASSEFYANGKYELAGEGQEPRLRRDGRVFSRFSVRYPIVSIEDGMDEDDWEGWASTEAIGDKIQLVGDDLFVTNPVRLHRGIKENLANGILVKVNQIGTLTETPAVDGTTRRFPSGHVASFWRD